MARLVVVTTFVDILLFLVLTFFRPSQINGANGGKMIYWTQRRSFFVRFLFPWLFLLLLLKNPVQKWYNRKPRLYRVYHPFFMWVAGMAMLVGAMLSNFDVVNVSLLIWMWVWI